MKALIFDMDGTLVNSLPFHWQARLTILKKYGAQLNPDILRLIKNESFNTLINQAFGNRFSQEEIKKLHKEKQHVYRTLLGKHVHEIEGLKKFLKESKKSGYLLALSTMGSKENVDFVIKKLEIENFFDVIVSGEKVKNKKPHPEIYQHTLDLLNISSSEAIVFEDSFAGVQSAQHAGLDVFGVTTSHTKEQFNEWGVNKCLSNYNEYHKLNMN
jgi:beta-phosphoglucomutase